MTSDRRVRTHGEPADPHLLACEVGSCSEPARYFTSLLFNSVVTRRAMCAEHAYAVAQQLVAAGLPMSFFVRPLI